MNISNQTHNLKCILRLLTYDKYYNVSLQGVAYTPLFAQFLAYKALVSYQVGPKLIEIQKGVNIVEFFADISSDDDVAAKKDLNFEKT